MAKTPSRRASSCCKATVRRETSMILTRLCPVALPSSRTANVDPLGERARRLFSYDDSGDYMIHGANDAIPDHAGDSDSLFNSLTVRGVRRESGPARGSAVTSQDQQLWRSKSI